MIYRFIDNKGSFVVENPQRYNLYFPLTDSKGTLLSSISPNLAGDIKSDNGHFLTPPASILDLKSNPLCLREFFIKTDKDTFRLSRPYQDTLEAGLLYHKLIKKAGPFYIEIVNFIPYDAGCELMWVKVRNTAKKRLNITCTSFIPLFGRGEKNLRDHRHVSSLLNRVTLEKYGILLKPTMVFDEKGHSINQTNYFVLGFQGKCRPPQGQFPTFECFFGEGDIISPEAIEKNIQPANRQIKEFNGKEVCSALRFHKIRLEAGQEADYFLLMGIAEDRGKIKGLFKKFDSPEKIKNSLKDTKGYWQKYLGNLSFDFRDKNFNNWLLWVRLQPTLRKLFGCSFLPHFDYGKGGRGWRDLWQDALTLILTEPDKALDLVFNSFKGVRLDGSNATIITKEGDFIADRNRINRVWMDHGIWPYLSCLFYVNKRQDPDFLLKEQTYFKDHQLKRAREIDEKYYQKDFIQRDIKGKIYRGNILEHILLENLVQFFNVGSHNIIRLENADWNDGLDMAADKGESVTFSFMYASNLKSLCELLKVLKEKRESIFLLKELTLLLDRLNKPVNYNDFKEKQKRLNAYLEKVKKPSGTKVKIKIDDLILDLKEKSQHQFSWLNKKEWLKEGFFNGYYDNKGMRVEGKLKGKVRMMLASQVFAIMSGVATQQQIKKVWHTVNRYLKDKKLGGFRLNTDFGSVYMDLGRAFGFSYGDKENGSFFSHMNVMFAHALYKRGFIKEGFAVINSLYKMATADKGEVYPLVPEYFNDQGRGLYFYLTGSASWYIYTLMEEILGIKFLASGILLEPKLLTENFTKKDIHAQFRLKEKKKIKIIFLKTANVNRTLRIKEVFLQEKKIPPSDRGYLIRKEKLNKRENTIKVYLG
jgi:cellobiose phosphorylase